MAADPGATSKSKRAKGIDARLARSAEKSAERLARKADNLGLGMGRKAGLLAGVAGLSAVGTAAGVSAAGFFSKTEHPGRQSANTLSPQIINRRNIVVFFIAQVTTY